MRGEENENGFVGSEMAHFSFASPQFQSGYVL